ncbi:DMT family transporter [Arthrobacter celericrescens]|uniref:DMT family transporter n=1 Tax=Arthrobacter celericrescens TaxID=2320851 RepID=UPI0019691A57|nr:DMT family transporter [Arthrobacter celericrescens]
MTAATQIAGRGWGVLAILLASVLWGTTGTAASFAPGVGSFAIGAAAMGIGGLLQAAIAARPILAFRSALAGSWPVIAVGAIAVAVYPLAFYSSMRLAGVAIGTVVSLGSAPLASAVIERVMDKRPFTTRWALGAALGLCGALFLCLAGPAHSASGPEVSGWATSLGIGVGLIAGLSYAVYSWAAHRLIGRGIPSTAAMGSVFGVGGLLLLPVLAVTGAPFLSSWQNLAVGAYMAAVPMFAGYVLFGWGLARVGAGTATTLTLSEIVVAAVLAVLVVGEQLSAVAWTGAALITGSLFILTVPSPRRRRRRPDDPATDGGKQLPEPAARG